jgi:hypothetical protein
MLVTFLFIHPEVVWEDFDCSLSKPPIVGTPGSLSISLMDSVWLRDSGQFSSIIRVTTTDSIGALTIPLKIFVNDVVTHQLVAPDSVDFSTESPFSTPYVMERVIDSLGSTALLVDIGRPSVVDSVDWTVLTMTMDPPPENDLLVVLTYTTLPPQEYNPHSGEYENVNYPMGLDLRKPFRVWQPGGLSPDTDEDGFPDPIDNCPEIPNPLQTDATYDGIGDTCCCIDTTGNYDCDPANLVDIGDLTRLIDFLYISNDRLCCIAGANVDGDNENLVDIGDLTALISYLYIPPNPALEACPW